MNKTYMGASGLRERADNDFYATPEKTTLALLTKEEILYPALEPACGDGRISRLLENGNVTSTDLVYRGYGRGGVNFITDDFEPVKTVITNPPFSMFTQFITKGLVVATHKLILFGRLQALEGKARAGVLEKSPLRTVYVFKSRQNPLRNGQALNERGKPWSGVMAFAWYVWEKGYTGKPMIEWI